MLLVPVWMLIAASALQLMPELRGEWMFDPLEGSVQFVEYGFFAQWFRGGVVATGVLGLASPIFGVALLLNTGLGSIARARSRSEALRYDRAAGHAGVAVDLVVRKRKLGTTKVAIPVEVIPASPQRRLLARLIDLGVLFGAALGGSVIGFLATAGTLDWGEVAWTWTVLGAVLAGVTLSTLQWAAVIDRGQTLGKVLFDIREVQPERDAPAPWFRGVVLRHLIPEVLTYVVAMAIAVVVGLGVVRGLEQLEMAGLFELTAVRILFAMCAWPVAVVALDLTRTVGLLFGHPRTLHDRLARTRVVRTSLGQSSGPGTVPLGFRMVARGLDLAAAASLIGLPLALSTVLVQGAGLSPSGVLGAGAAAGGVLLLLFEIWQWVSLSTTGTTLGKRRVGIEVSRTDDTPVGFGALVVSREWIGVGLFSVFLPILWPIADFMLGLGDDARTGHDRLADTRVIWSDPQGSDVD